jgi:hypothetical protein
MKGGDCGQTYEDVIPSLPGRTEENTEQISYGIWSPKLYLKPGMSTLRPLILVSAWWEGSVLERGNHCEFHFVSQHSSGGLRKSETSIVLPGRDSN